LIYGQPNQAFAEQAKTAVKPEHIGKNMQDPGHVATHIAFLCVPRWRIKEPPTGTSPQACCMLEREATIFAPDKDLTECIFLNFANLFPVFTGCFETED
jgi:hypothetical protein